MNQEVKPLWLAALRSGQYPQGQSTLRKRYPDEGPDTFCCLGVLCELAVAAGIIPAPRVDPEDNVYTYGAALNTRNTGGNSTWALPDVVATWAGVDRFGSVRDPETGYCVVDLISLNDRGSSFLEIADQIEAHL
jgi:hypothetical protein